MAKLKLQGHASGTGIFTLSPPNSSTDRTITLPDSSGALLTDGSTIGTSQIADDAVTAAKLANSINTDIATGVTANTTANAALPKAGGTMTGNVTHSSGYLDMGANHVYLADNAQVKLGTSEDLQIYHDGSHSYVSDTGTGNLNLKGQNLNLLASNSNDYLRCVQGGAVELYHNNVKKFETTAAGATVTGTLTADLADNSIDSEHYVDGSIDTAHLANNSVTGAKIPDGAISTSGKIANDIIDSQHYADGSIDTAHIGDNQITAAKLSDSMGDCALGVTKIGIDAGDQVEFNNNTDMRFKVNGNEEMRLEADGDLHVDGDVIAYSTTISDERLKDNIEVVNGALDKVKELKGVTFNRKQDGQKSAGVIAQDVEKVLPEAVKHKALPLHTGDDELFKTVQYDALHALLIEAVKELSEKVEKLENK